MFGDITNRDRATDMEVNLLKCSVTYTDLDLITAAEVSPQAEAVAG
jgi:hypothetical protein